MKFRANFNCLLLSKENDKQELISDFRICKLSIFLTTLLVLNLSACGIRSDSGCLNSHIPFPRIRVLNPELLIPYYHHYEFNGVITSIDNLIEDGSTYKIVRLNIDSFKSPIINDNPDSMTRDSVTLKYKISGFNSALLPSLIKGDKLFYKFRAGFKGKATGIIVSDSKGIKYIHDDGSYGNALTKKETQFTFKQVDAGCRHNKDSNSFYLEVKKNDQTAKIHQGEEAILEGDGNYFKVTVLGSYKRTSDIIITEVPSSHYSYIIRRL